MIDLTKPPLRIGLLGSGEMGKRHLAAAQGLSSVEMLTRALPRFQALDRPAFLHALLADPTVDAIDICLPTPLHAPTACAALAAGKHVLCEKPMAPSTADCARILATARDSGRVFMVAHVLRFFPAYRHLLRVVRGGHFGPVLRAAFTRFSGIPAWAAWLSDPAQSGGAVLDLLVHDFDQVLLLFGPPSHIQAAFTQPPHALRADLTCSGIPVRVEGGWFPDTRAFAMEFDVVFAQARLVYRDNQLALHAAGGAPQLIDLGNTDPYREQLRYFTQCCFDRTPPVDCAPESSAAAVALALHVRDRAAHASSLPPTREDPH